ncbi:restriction endonuclease subunit S, partial [Candidatus Pelagibacter sp.]|nr:restriction endonuclease subunit S [Candidatus Pelagibacter sp.]
YIVKSNDEFYFKDASVLWLNRTSNILSKYVDYFIKSDLFKSQLDVGNGATVDTLTIKKLSSIKIIVPSIEEQKRTVAKLDAAFAEINKTIDTTINNYKNVKNITQLFFNNLKNQNINNLCENNIGELCDLMTGGTPNTKNKSYYTGGKIPWLVSGDVNKNIINDCVGRITETGYKNSNTRYLPINSVVIALNGQGKTRGTVALLKIKATCNQSLVCIHPKVEKKINTELIFYYLKSIYEQIRKITGDSGNDRRGLNMPLIRAIKIKYPENYEEQIKLVNKIKTITEYVMKMEENYRSKINNLLKLKQAILGNSLIQKDLEAA